MNTKIKLKNNHYILFHISNLLEEYYSFSRPLVIDYAYLDFNKNEITIASLNGSEITYSYIVGSKKIVDSFTWEEVSFFYPYKFNIYSFIFFEIAEHIPIMNDNLIEKAIKCELNSFSFLLYFLDKIDESNYQHILKIIKKYENEINLKDKFVSKVISKILIYTL